MLINIWSKSLQLEGAEEKMEMVKFSVFRIFTSIFQSFWYIKGLTAELWHKPLSKVNTRRIQIQTSFGAYLDFDSFTEKFRKKPEPWGAQWVSVSSSSKDVKIFPGWLSAQNGKMSSPLKQGSPGDTRGNYGWPAGNAGLLA